MAQVDHDLTTVSWVDEQLRLIKNLVRHTNSFSTVLNPDRGRGLLSPASGGAEELPRQRAGWRACTRRSTRSATLGGQLWAVTTMELLAESSSAAALDGKAASVALVSRGTERRLDGEGVARGADRGELTAATRRRRPSRSSLARAPPLWW
jgi:hypothetical protein